MKIQEVVDFCNARFHPELQENYDNAGFLLGEGSRECQGVLVSVDLTPKVIDEAIGHGLNLIVTHHPFIFSGLKRITTDSETGRMVYRLIRNNIAVYAAHTNLDNLMDGVNGILAQKLGLQSCAILHPMVGHTDVGSGMIGTLPTPMPIGDFFQMVKSVLGLPILRSSADSCNKVSRVAICGGAGSFLIGDAIAAGADIYLTGDMKYHDFQRAEGRITLVDIGHYESEQFVKELISLVISQNFNTFACRISDTGNGYVSYI